MPFVRRRPLVRAAMVGGAAYHAGKTVEQGRAADHERDARIAKLEQEQAAGPAGASAPPASDVVDQLERLGRLKDQGVLTQDEFESQKRKLLGAS